MQENRPGYRTSSGKHYKPIDMKRILKKLLAPVIREVADEILKELCYSPSLSPQEVKKVVENAFETLLLKHQK